MRESVLSVVEVESVKLSHCELSYELLLQHGLALVTTIHLLFWLNVNKNKCIKMKHHK